MVAVRKKASYDWPEPPCPNCRTAAGAYELAQSLPGHFRCCYCDTVYTAQTAYKGTPEDAPVCGEDLDDTIERLRGGRNRKGGKRGATAAQMDSQPAKPVLGRLVEILGTPTRGGDPLDG